MGIEAPGANVTLRMRKIIPGYSAPASTAPITWASTPGAMAGLCPKAEFSPNPIANPAAATAPILIDMRFMADLPSLAGQNDRKEKSESQLAAEARTWACCQDPTCTSATPRQASEVAGSICMPANV